MSNRVLDSGSDGLFGTALRRAIDARGIEVVGLHRLAQGAQEGDVCRAECMHAAAATCGGVLHLSVFSRARSLSGLTNLLRDASRCVEDIGGLTRDFREELGTIKHAGVVA